MINLLEQTEQINNLIEHIKIYAKPYNGGIKAEIKMFQWDLDYLEAILESLHRLKDLEK